MLDEQTHQKLTAMKLFGMAHSIRERLGRRDHQDLSKAEFVGLLVDDEWLYRENRKLGARLRVAKFKQRAASLENLDYATPRGLRKDQILELAQNRWISAHQSLLIVGPPDRARASWRRPSGNTPAAAASPCNTCACRRCYRSSSRHALKVFTIGCSSAWP